MKSWVFSALLAGAAIAEPALADEYYAVTPSGAAELVFALPSASVVQQLGSRCIDSGWRIITSSSNEILCESPMSDGQAILGQFLMGNSYSTPPKRYFRFNVAELNGLSRVQASGWVELQMAFGQIKRTDFTGPEFYNSIIIFMSNAGGEYPVGTRFPNHALLGVEATSDFVPFGKKVGMKVKEVPENAAATLAGVQIGDLIYKIAGKDFATTDRFFDATAKAAKTSTYPIELIRDGKVVKLTVNRVFRSAIIEGPKPFVVAAPATNTPPPATVSKADELAKLAKLKAEGILTDAEFAAEKAKILAQ